jgi:hypothetical protein
VRLWTRNGYDWSSRYPRIVEAGVDGIADLNGLHSRQHDEEVQFYAFDVFNRSAVTNHTTLMLRRIAQYRARTGLASGKGIQDMHRS